MAKAKSETATTGQAVALTGEAPKLLSKGYTVARRVTVPLKLMQTGDQFEFTVEGEMTGGEPIEGKGKFTKSMIVCPVIDLETGESVTLICPTVLESALKRTPGGYVGKSFVAIQGPKMPLKGYHQIELFELKGAK